MSKEKKLTTAAGIPVPDNQTSLTAGERGPTLMQDHYLLEKLAHFTYAMVQGLYILTFKLHNIKKSETRIIFRH